jgi:hypothetical protein
VPNNQLIIWDVSNERVMPNGDRRIFGFPAVSLPSLRFLPYLVVTPMIARGFSA